MTDTQTPPTTRRLSRQRDCDPATSHDLAALDALRLPYEIIESTPAATVLRFTSHDLQRLSHALGHRQPSATGGHRCTQCP